MLHHHLSSFIKRDEMDTIVLTTMGYLGGLGLSRGNHRKAFVSALVCCGISRVLSRSFIGLQRENYPLEAWIEKEEKEDALDPDQKIIDPHHHLWDPKVQDKGWHLSKSAFAVLYNFKPFITHKLITMNFTPDMWNTFGKRAPFAMPYMINEMLRDIDNNDGGSGHQNQTGHNITHTVYMECGWKDPAAENEAFSHVPEAEMAQKVANQTNGRICSGIVGFIDLRLGAKACEPAMIALKERVPNFRGLRHSLAWSNSAVHNNPHCDKDTAYDPQFRSAFALLTKFDLSYDCWLYHENLPALMDLALAFPETTIILDHVGLPLGVINGCEAVREEWASSISELASKCPNNVYVKLSGLGMKVCGFGLDERLKPPTSFEVAELWKPYILHCIKCFGVERCMFASNFPVDKISCSYTVLWNAFKRIVSTDAGFSAEDRHALFYGTAKRVYKLN